MKGIVSKKLKGAVFNICDQMNNGKHKISG